MDFGLAEVSLQSGGDVEKRKRASKKEKEPSPQQNGIMGLLSDHRV